VVVNYDGLPFAIGDFKYQSWVDTNDSQPLLNFHRRFLARNLESSNAKKWVMTNYV
jgi:hypothetical protein